MDRWDRRRTMIAADTTRMLLILPLLLRPSTGWLWLVYVVAFLESSWGSSLTRRAVRCSHAWWVRIIW